MIYTKTGDRGTTSLVGGTRVPKDSMRLEAYGTVDELNSWIGLLCADPACDDADRDTLTYIQNRLFDIGSELATEPASAWQPVPMSAVAAQRLEREIDRLDAALPRHNRFILPGGSQSSARAHIARTVARRAERRIVTLSETDPVNPHLLAFVNRLSDYLFVLARHFNAGHPEVYWTSQDS